MSAVEKGAFPQLAAPDPFPAQDSCRALSSRRPEGMLHNSVQLGDASVHPSALLENPVK